jgi:hypothetical protein
MAAAFGHIDCKLYPSAFSGELVFQVDTTTGESYEGIAPKHYANSSVQPTQNGVDGRVKVRVLSNGGDKARVSVPDGQILTVSADKVHEI